MSHNREAQPDESGDLDCMARLAGGEDLALNELMDRWSERVAAFLFRMTGNWSVAADLAQDTFVRVYQARHSYRPNHRFSTYLFTIASNLAKNHLRWKARHPTVSLDETDEEAGARVPEPADPAKGPDEAAAHAERARAIRQALLSLPTGLREIMALFLEEGLSHADIAKLLGCSTKAVETRVYRARQLLRDRLKHLID